ncbi:hypothetical protein PMIN07_008843 [Paraphaeosphaeria minitans]
MTKVRVEKVIIVSASNHRMEEGAKESARRKTVAMEFHAGSVEHVDWAAVRDPKVSSVSPRKERGCSSQEEREKKGIGVRRRLIQCCAGSSSLTLWLCAGQKASMQGDYTYISKCG